MIKIWAKIMFKQKIQKQYVLSLCEGFDINHLLQYLMDICYELDIQTPIILSSHYKHMIKFNHTKFMKSDFIDKVNFDYLLIEILA